MKPHLFCKEHPGLFTEDLAATGVAAATTFAAADYVELVHGYSFLS